MNKNIFITILLILLLIFTTGCTMYEIEDYFIVAGIGIDYNNNQFEVTYEIYEEKDGQTTELSSIIKSGKGEVISHAINEMTLQMNKQPYLNHCSVIIINENVLKEKFSETMNYLLHDVRIRSACYVMVTTKQSAKEIFQKSEEQNKVIAYDLYKHFDKKENLLSKWTDSKFNKILNDKVNINGNVIVPVIEYENECDINGAFIIKNDNSYIECNSDEIYIFQIFNKCLSEGLLNQNNKYLYLKQINSNYTYKDNSIKLNVEMKVLSYDYINSSEEEQYINQLKESLNTDIIKVFNKYTSLGFDPFSIYKNLENHHLDKYQNIKEEYNIFLQKLELQIILNIDLLTSGLSEERIE